MTGKGRGGASPSTPTAIELSGIFSINVPLKQLDYAINWIIHRGKVELPPG
jgi:hypothetical protein